MKDWFDENSIVFLFSIAFAMFCGGLSYMYKVVAGKVFKWGELVLSVAISGAAGLICYQILEYFELPSNIMGAFCGITGWMGTRAFKIFEEILSLKLGVKASQTENSDNTDKDSL